MSTGIPRTYQKVTEAARELGYAYSHANGGHHFYTKKNPDKSLGQESRLVIPYPKIKGTKTLYNILDGMGYFEAHGLGRDGQPRAERVDVEQEAREERKRTAEFISLTREWKKAMKSFARGLRPEKPGPAPVRRGPEPANTP